MGSMVPHQSISCRVQASRSKKHGSCKLIDEREEVVKSINEQKTTVLIKRAMQSAKDFTSLPAVLALVSELQKLPFRIKGTVTYRYKVPLSQKDRKWWSYKGTCSVPGGAEDEGNEVLAVVLLTLLAAWKNLPKNIKNDAGEAWDPFKKMRLEKSCRILRELCIYNVLGASLGQKHRKIIKQHLFSGQNNENVLEKLPGFAF